MSRELPAAYALVVLLLGICLSLPDAVKTTPTALAVLAGLTLLCSLAALPVPGGGALSFSFVWVFSLGQIAGIQQAAIASLLAVLLRALVIERDSAVTRASSAACELIPTLSALVVLGVPSSESRLGFPRGGWPSLVSLLLMLAAGHLCLKWLAERREGLEASRQARALQYRLNALLAPAAALLSGQNLWWGLWMVPVMLGIQHFSWDRVEELRALAGQRSKTEEELKHATRALEVKSVRLANTEDDKDLVERCLEQFSSAGSLELTRQAILELALELSPATRVGLFEKDRNELRCSLWLTRAKKIEEMPENSPLWGLVRRAFEQNKISRDRDAANWAFPLFADGVLLLSAVPRPLSEEEKRACSLLSRQATFGLRNGVLFEELRVTVERERQARQDAVKAKSELLASQENLIRSSRLAAVGQLAAGVAHELNSPLAAIRLAVQAGKRTLASGQSEKTLSRFEQCEEATRKAQRIVDGLLTQSRSSQEGKTRFDLGALVGRTCLFLQDRLQRSGSQTDLRLTDGVFVMADSDEIAQIVTNLVLNADQAQEKKAGARILLELRCESGTAILEVADQGPGIPQAYSERVFEAFFTTRPEGKGTGLGLFVSRQLAERNAAGLTLVPSAPPGARFRLSLPVSP